MSKKLINLTQNVDYAIGKLGEAIVQETEDQGLMEMASSVYLPEIKTTCQNIKDALNAKIPNYVEDDDSELFIDIDYILIRLEEWLKNTRQNFLKKDANIFMIAFNAKFQELKDLLNVLDNQ